MHCLLQRYTQVYRHMHACVRAHARTHTHTPTHTHTVSVTDSGGKGQCTTGRRPIIVLTQRSGVTRLCPAKCQRKAQLRGDREGRGLREGRSRVGKRIKGERVRDSGNAEKGSQMHSRQRRIHTVWE